MDCQFYLYGDDKVGVCYSAFFGDDLAENGWAGLDEGLAVRRRYLHGGWRDATDKRILRRLRRRANARNRRRRRLVGLFGRFIYAE